MKRIRILWGGRLESNGKRHGENRAVQRNISPEMIRQTLAEPERMERQSTNCLRYFKTFGERSLCVVAVTKANGVHEIITCFQEEHENSL